MLDAPPADEDGAAPLLDAPPADEDGAALGDWLLAGVVAGLEAAVPEELHDARLASNVNAAAAVSIRFDRIGSPLLVGWLPNRVRLSLR